MGSNCAVLTPSSQPFGLLSVSFAKEQMETFRLIEFLLRVEKKKKRMGRCWHSSSCSISASYQDGKRNKLCIQKCQNEENGINHKFNNQVQIITRIFNANYAESDNGEMCVTKKHLRSIQTEAYHNRTHFTESFFIHAHTHTNLLLPFFQSL